MEVREMSDRKKLHLADSRTPASDAAATVAYVLPETLVFQAYRGSSPPRFANPAELEYAKILDWYGVPWLYEPRTFVLERDDDGRVTEAFAPDFYLPDQ